MEMMTRTGERMDTTGIPVVQAGTARMRDLTPAQRRAVLFAQQQVLRARAAKKAKDERQAEINRMRLAEDSFEEKPQPVVAPQPVVRPEGRDVSLREAIGHVLRELRTHDNKTLREVSEKAGVSLGYLSEVERGQKEASSELLSSIAGSLGVTTAQMLRMVADYLDAVSR
ncbi:helix-turn-helix domain-containing protein [Bifidobacterium leontopitheci]|uniref:XRE family transcriptional regulator n=1 Tax=Bifidobacterium leontopitheci TaxID=2650774 RepID=A0A6I1GNR6_9BIFI|nr:helix-turn-helix transcriptional regulator [Bifidobacterium leontopitheci]KAB7791186.1 XRE family transcriptional regulator [Bifidobacterium leontopitheci]